MKRLLAVILVAIALTACGSGDPGEHGIDGPSHPEATGPIVGATEYAWCEAILAARKLTVVDSESKMAWKAYNTLQIYGATNDFISEQACLDVVY
jgi:Asp/Glu/hydantoin racemase